MLPRRIHTSIEKPNGSRCLGPQIYFLKFGPQSSLSKKSLSMVNRYQYVYLTLKRMKVKTLCYPSQVRSDLQVKLPFHCQQLLIDPYRDLIPTLYRSHALHKALTPHKSCNTSFTCLLCNEDTSHVSPYSSLNVTTWTRCFPRRT